MPATRSPAQIEASRRNGARSKDRSPRRARTRLAQRAQARPHRHAPSRARGRGARRAGSADRHHRRGDGCRDRDRGPAGTPPRHRLVEGRAGRADRDRPVRRRAEAAAAADGLPVGGGGPADHLRPQALQRDPRLPGPAGTRDQPLPQGAAPVAQGRARGVHGRTRGAAGKRTQEPACTRQRRRLAAPRGGRSGSRRDAGKRTRGRSLGRPAGARPRRARLAVGGRRLARPRPSRRHRRAAAPGLQPADLASPEALVGRALFRPRAAPLSGTRSGP